MKAEDVPDYVREEDQFLKEDGQVDCTRHVLRALDAIGIEAMIAIGGDDTLSYAARLHEEDFPTVGYRLKPGQRVVCSPRGYEVSRFKCIAPISTSLYCQLRQETCLSQRQIGPISTISGTKGCDWANLDDRLKRVSGNSEKPTYRKTSERFVYPWGTSHSKPWGKSFRWRLRTISQNN